MKEEAATTSGKDAAAPSAIGGAASKPSRRVNKKRLVKIGLVVLAVLAIGGAAFAVWKIFFYQDPNYLNISGLNSQDTYIKRAQEYAKEPVPEAPKDKAVYYGNIALALKDGKEYVHAERYYLLAQKTVDDNNVDKKEVNFYFGLSELYKAWGNKHKADEYAKKEQDFLKANYPPDVLKQMQEVKLNDPPR